MTNSDEKKQVIRVAQALLMNVPSPLLLEQIREKVKIAINTCKLSNVDVSSVDENMLVAELESLYTTWIGHGTILENPEDHIAWLADRKSDIDWDFWDRYRLYMEEQGRAPQILDRLDEMTDQILGRLEDPKRTEAWDRRGMVVGHVQSGKTANYTGLICKAADAGYKVIVVLAGMHNNLRSQTQLRLDAGFLGRDSQIGRAYKEGVPLMGAGKILTRRKLIVHSLTSSADEGDFNTRVASQLGLALGGQDPILLVVKKYKSVLDNLVRWALSTVGTHSGKRIIRGVPLLVIDDEADQASINTKVALDESGRIIDEEEVTTINGLIRRLLKSFEQSAYVGYTATPFANIFIYPNTNTEELSERYGEDLFPRSFIINLPVPSNYVGPAQVFGLEADAEIDLDAVEGLPIIRTVLDQENWMPVKHKKEHRPPYLPSSLKKAIRAFILTCTVRLLRGQEAVHNSMLIHVTRFTDVQKKVTALVKEELSSLQNRLRYGEGNAKNSILQEFKSLWLEDFLPTTESVKSLFNDPSIKVLEWSEIVSALYRAASKIQVKEINGSAKDALEYFEHKNGLSVIAIGGNKLSRGLTLEDLSISYFLRASKMYDTLMQMGRWFGYRPGFLDLCRLYTDPELIEWYKHITVASEELRQEFNRMADIGQTPDKYGLKVRTHPQGLMITGVNKMRTGTEMKLSYAETPSETTIFYKERDINWANYKATETFLSNIGQPLSVKERDNYIWTDISADKVLDFLLGYTTHTKCKPADTRKLCEYIEAQLPHDELITWTVVLVSNNKGNPHNIAEYNIGLTVRRESEDFNSHTEYRLRKSRLLNPTDEWLDLSKDLRDLIIQETREERERRGKRSSVNTPNGQILRSKRSSKKALILLYPLDPSASEIKHIEFDDFPIIGFVISFPGSQFARKIKYRVNNPYWEQEFGEL